MRSDECGKMFCSRIKNIDFCLANSEEGLLKVVTSLGKLEKDKIENKRIV